MSSDKPEQWKRKIDITYEEYFNPPWFLPHIGLIELVRKLEEVMGTEQVHILVDKVAGKLMRESINRVKGGVAVDDFQAALGVLRKFNSQKIFEGAHEMEVVERSPNRSVSNIRKCIWAETFRSLGAADIGYTWECKQDYVLASAIHPRFKLKRTKTLMQGDDCCDFCWYWEEEE